MSTISLRLANDGVTVEIELADLTTAQRSEIEYQLLLAGATRSGGGLHLNSFAFRRTAPELAPLLRRTGAEVLWDAGVESLLVTQLDEIRARQSAQSADPLGPDDVEVAVRATGRFTRPLTDRQQANLGRLLALPHGANFSVPGAGKTATLLATYEAVRGHDRVDRLLVVAPKNAFVSWEDEVSACYEQAAPVISRAVGGRAGVAAVLVRDPEIILMTYQLLPNVIDLVKNWARRHRAHVVLDESHRTKAGYAGVTASAALQLAEVATRRDILSGTPLPHQPEDLRPQLDFLWPGQRILPDFRLLSDAPPNVIEDVERSVRPLYVRTTKDQLALPDLSITPIPVTLGPLQRELYELLRSEAARAAAGMAPRDRRFFRALGRHVIRLIQAATNPMLLAQSALVDGADQNNPQQERAWELLREVARDANPAKLARAVELTNEAVERGERVLLWTGFIMNLHLLAEQLVEHNPVLIYGAIPTGDVDDDDSREGRIRRFHEDPACRVMIANPAAAGEGISLHRACQYAIYLDRTFNAAHFMQSVDRIHRLGSERPSRVAVLQASGTIDIQIQQRLATKILAMSQILNDEGLRALAYDPEDIDEEFDGGIDLDDIEEIIEHLTGDGGDS
jgi:SNF2 family DNA or RNA helicase